MPQSHCRFPIADCRIEGNCRVPIADCRIGGTDTHSFIRKSEIGNRQCPASPRGGFTLVEVLIAIAIALLLIVGVSQIFAIAQRTTGMGTALLNTVAADRSLQSTLNRDFHTIVPLNASSSPGFVIASYSAAIFRNKSDFDASTNQGDPLDFGPNFTNPTAPYAQAFSTNFRVHRLDRLCFFARDLYHRQTADAPSLSSSRTSTEAFIWYGHLALPNNPAITNYQPANPGTANGAGSGWFNPGVPAIATPINDNNQFASQMILGRQVMMLVPRPVGGSVPESGYMIGGGSLNLPLFLDQNTTSVRGTYDTSGGNAPLFSSRYDLCYTTIALWNSLIGTPGNFPTVPWWEQLSGLRFTGVRNGNISNDYRYYANPFPTRPDTTTAPLDPNWNSAASAQTSPIFVRGCSQFIVEFAGDFVTQDPVTGQIPAGPIAAATPDGTIDFIIDPVTRQRRIRWYGFPRDTSTSTGPNAGALQPDGNFDTNDVMPVGKLVGARQPFEKQFPTDVNPGQYLFAMTGQANTNGGDPSLNFPKHSQAYVCAWGPDQPNQPRPKMIRITVAVDDPNGRLNNEQTYEYIFTLP